MAAAAPFLLAAGTAVSAVASISSGIQQRKAYETQAKQAELQAEAQITERTRALNEALATQNAMIGGSGRNLSSIESVIKGDVKRYEEDKEIIKTGAQLSSSQLQSAGSSSMAQGVMGAVSTAAMGGYKYSLIK